LVQALARETALAWARWTAPEWAPLWVPPLGSELALMWGLEWGHRLVSA